MHNSRGHSLHGIWGGVHTEHNVSAAWGTEAWKPQALTQAPYDLFYREFLGKISWKSENTGLGYFERNHIVLKTVFPLFVVFLLVQKK